MDRECKESAKVVECLESIKELSLLDRKSPSRKFCQKKVFISFRASTESTLKSGGVEPVVLIAPGLALYRTASSSVGAGGTSMPVCSPAMESTLVQKVNSSLRRALTIL